MTSASQCEWTTGKVWAVAAVLIVALISMTVIWSTGHPYVFRIEMDNNTLEAVKSLNYSELAKVKSSQTPNQIYWQTNQTLNFSDFTSEWYGEGCWKANDGCNRCCGPKNGTHYCTLMACFHAEKDDYFANAPHWRIT